MQYFCLVNFVCFQLEIQCLIDDIDLSQELKKVKKNITRIFNKPLKFI